MEDKDNSRQVLRPWLEGILNNKTIPGVQWIEQGTTTFQIPWPRSGKNCSNKNEMEIFKKWAEHTGRYRNGIDKEDYVKWKTRLRCALNKSKDFEEVQLEKNMNDPAYKYFKIRSREVVRPSNKEFSEERKVTVTKVPEVPVPVENENNENESLPSDLKGINTNDLYDADVQMLSDNLQSVAIQNNNNLEQQIPYADNSNETNIQIELDFLGVKTSVEVHADPYRLGLLIDNPSYDPQITSNELWRISKQNLGEGASGLLEMFQRGLLIKYMENQWKVYNLNEHPVWFEVLKDDIEKDEIEVGEYDCKPLIDHLTVLDESRLVKINITLCHKPNTTQNLKSLEFPDFDALSYNLESDQLINS